MRFPLSLLMLVASATSADVTIFTAAIDEHMEDEVTLDGSKLFQRDLANNQNNGNQGNQNNQGNYNYNQNGNYQYNQNNQNRNNGANAYGNGEYYHYYSWMKNYSVRFLSCHELPQYDNQGLAFKHQTMVKFRLCPSNHCDWRCRGGAVYAADAKDFVPSFLESKMTYDQKTCKYQQQQCKYYCMKNNGYYDDNCSKQCLNNAGYNSCYQDVTKGNLEIENYLDCTRLSYTDASTGKYFYGKVYCGLGGRSMHMGIYEDASCTKRYENGPFDFTKSYGVTLPYTKDSIVSRECVTCREDANNHNYYDKADADDVTYNCESLYSKSLKCESRRFLDAINPNRDGCRFIKRTLPAMDDINRGSRRRIFTTILAWMFGILAFYLLVIACMMGKKKLRDRSLDRDVDNSLRYRSAEKDLNRDVERHSNRVHNDLDEHSVNTHGTSSTSKSRRSKSPFRYFKKNRNGELA